MKKASLWVLAAALICGIMMVSCSSKSTEVCPEEDSSQFVTLTEVVPDAILEIRYFGTYNFV